MQKKYSLCASKNHQHCIDDAVAAAQQLCEQQGVRLTPLRKRVLMLVWQTHQPIGAYDILHQLRNEDGRPAAPPTVYRALDFLLENGLIHRIASLNAYIGCNAPEHQHHAQFLICRMCRFTRELSCSAIDSAIERMTDEIGFAVESQVIEISGLCAPCQATL